ncbi:hypothetical protein [Bythopirellula polymerisocia]|uniref:Uncharacterized protein n=1 Tax=Bythopirellula polymerisocia TaxID=2528003 RepID=A0A5C6C8B5_9BACT|nr:hypothetical protein [Bythopirellula polymerisocia]TWU20770.1 hypothetical protein Pla144_48210 [Bythopirellula polymerisocia]
MAESGKEIAVSDPLVGGGVWQEGHPSCATGESARWASLFTHLPSWLRQRVARTSRTVLGGMSATPQSAFGEFPLCEFQCILRAGGCINCGGLGFRRTAGGVSAESRPQHLKRLANSLKVVQPPSVRSVVT